jgi:EF hand
MGRIVLGAFAALLMAAAGLFWWQGRAETERAAPPPSLAGPAPVADQSLPDASGLGLRGALPPAAEEASREQKRFGRLDRDRDGRITRNEMLAPRAAAFRKLDKDGNNLLSFEEWAVRTSGKFSGADVNRDGALNAAEFARTKPKRRAEPRCRCAPAPRKAGSRMPEPAESDPDEAEPGG